MTWLTALMDRLRGRPRVTITFGVYNPFAPEQIATYERGGWRRLGLVFEKVDENGHCWGFVALPNPAGFTSQADFDEAIAATIGRFARTTDNVKIDGVSIQDENSEDRILQKLRESRRTQ